MTSLNLTASETLYESPLTRVVRGRLEGEAVIVKWSPGAEWVQLKREYDLLRTVDGQGAPRALGIESDPSSGVPRLTTQDVGGVSLARQFGACRTNATAVLRVALSLAEAVAAVHARAVVHRDINPSNVVVDIEGGVNRSGSTRS